MTGFEIFLGLWSTALYVAWWRADAKTSRLSRECDRLGKQCSSLVRALRQTRKGKVQNGAE